MHDELDPTRETAASERPPQSEPVGRDDPASGVEAEAATSPRRQRQDDFLAAYANAGVIAYAAHITGIDRTTHHVWLREDPTYRTRFEAAQDDAADKLKFDARCRALQGDEVAVFHQGKQVGVRREYSDKLLMFLLRTARPEKFADDAAIAAHAGKAPVQVIRYGSSDASDPLPIAGEPDASTRRRQDAFLAAYATSGVVAHAAKAAQIDRTTHYVWRKQDPTYALRFRSAQEDASDRLELQALRHARDGVLVPIFYRGVQVGVKKKKSVTLLMFLLGGAQREQARRGLDIAHPNERAPTIVCYPEPIDSMDEWSLRYQRLPSEPSQ